MKQSGSADLALMGGHIPSWLYERMRKMSLAIVEAILTEYGHEAFLARMADPFWFQSFGAVIGMDWNSSGVTTAVMRALKSSINPHGHHLGLYVCGGKGKESLKTPNELLRVGGSTGLNGDELARFSKLTAKVDNTAVQDGYQLYLHNFLISEKGDWTVVQQGMKTGDQSARRYHWHSQAVESFVNEPHAAVCGTHQGEILNLVSGEAQPTRDGIMEISAEDPGKMLKELPKLLVPRGKGIKAGDVNLKRLSAILHLAQEQETQQFEDLLLLKGLGPRTLQSLTLVSEVIHGTPSRFSDPARFAFAHGSKGGNPFPVPTRVYDETITTLRKAVDMAKIGQTDKQKAIQKLSDMARRAEKTHQPDKDVEELLEQERREAWKHGGRTMHGFVQPPKEQQLNL
ncbi:MAG: DUF763 domain-containing protein, partial [Bacteroidota bacterium]